MGICYILCGNLCDKYIVTGISYSNYSYLLLFCGSSPHFRAYILSVDEDFRCTEMFGNIYRIILKYFYKLWGSLTTPKQGQKKKHIPLLGFPTGQLSKSSLSRERVGHGTGLH